MSRVQAGALLGVVLGAASGVAHASVAAKAIGQRIAIEERASSKTSRGTFRLTPVTRGQVKAESGTIAFSVRPRGTSMVSGQRVTTYVVTDRLVGSRGTISLRIVMRSTDAGSGYVIASGPWSVVQGTKAYKGARGGGRASAVVTFRRQISTRYEGSLTLP
jgi:hypothetical protein